MINIRERSEIVESSREDIKKVLRPYNQGQRLLKTAQRSGDKIKGEFYIGPCYYVVGTPQLDHATDLEIQLCLNQLSYIHFFDALKRGEIPGLSEVSFEDLQVGNMFIVESRKRFRKPIPTDKMIYGEMTVKKIRQLGENLFYNLGFDFEDRSCVGKLKGAIVLS